MAPAPTTEQAMRQGRAAAAPARAEAAIRGGSRSARSSRRQTRFQTYEEGNLFRISVPSNWRELPANTAVTFAPEGAYGNLQGQSVFTHGLQIGVDQNVSRSADRDDRADQRLGQSNPRLRQKADSAT